MYSTVPVEKSQLLDRIEGLKYLHPYILTAFNYTNEKMAVELDMSVSQIIRYNPYSRCKTRTKPTLTVCRLTFYIVKELLSDGTNPKVPSLFNDYLLQAKNII